MNANEIKRFLELHKPKMSRTIVIVDFSNTVMWRKSLGWDIGIKELGNLVKHLSTGAKFLRRFYYGSDYGPRESETKLIAWSEGMLGKARLSGFEIITKRVKYMPDDTSQGGYEVKCDLDVEMTVDLIREIDNYDTVVLFSGDGDLACALQYLHDTYKKECIVFGVRGQVGRELIDLKASGKVNTLFFTEDFEYRLSYQRGFNHK